MVDIAQLCFTGLIANRLLDQVSGPEFMNALRKCGWTEAPGGHILKRLRQRGPRWGVSTPGEFARAVRAGVTTSARAGAMMRRCTGGSGSFGLVFRPDRGWLITVLDV